MIVDRVQEVMSRLEGSRSKVMSGLLGWRAQRLFPGLLLQLDNWQDVA